jgi:hypothetical protein
LGGNCWSSAATGGRIDTNGITAWSDSTVWFDTWLRVTGTGQLHIWVNAAVPTGKSRIGIGVAPDAMPDAHSKDLEIAGAALICYDAGSFTITDTGYQRIRIKALGRTGPFFATIPSIIVQGSPLAGRTAYVPNNDGNFFHWGRRGPSVHLNYVLPKGVAAEWFYNEVTVPEGQDVQGSYFMACGFAEGYFGMQVNGPMERHILFSVWSPFQTDDPQAIPDSLKIRMLKKGEGVHAGEFGSEGSGGQSYLNFPWKAGHTYRFLLHAHPADHGYTDFTAWFYASEQGHWRLIAAFSRPQTRSWLTNLHSFLENFEPEQGTHTRYVLFNHQWIRDTADQWMALNTAKFSVDNTGRKGYRMDFAGGLRAAAGGGAVNGSLAFFLQNDGFFNTYTLPGTWLERPKDGTDRHPDISLADLP